MNPDAGLLRRSWAVRYGAAALAPLIAAAIRIALTPLLGDRFFLTTFYPAIMATAWLGGVWPGVVSTLVSGLTADYLWFEPAGSLWISRPGDLVELILLIAIGLVISTLNETLHRGRARERSAREHAEQAEHEARVAQQKVTSLVESVPGVVWEAWGRPDSASQRLDFVSSHVKTMLGYSVEEWLRTPNFWLSVVHPDDRQYAAQVAARAFANGESHTNQFRWIAKDGRVLWVETRSIVIFDDSGKPSGMRGVTFDITAQKQAEQAVRHNLQDMLRMQQVSTRLLEAGDFSRLLEDILDAALEITGANMGTIQLLEGEVLRITAQRGFEAPFLEFFNAVGVEQAALVTSLQERVIVEDVTASSIFAGTPALDVMLAAGARSVQSTPLASRSGHLLGMFSTHYHEAPRRPSERALRLLDVLARQAADVIERKLGEEALRRSESRKASILESALDAIITMDQQGLIVDFNPAAEQLFGYPRDAVIGQAVATTVIPPRLREAQRVGLRRFLETGEGPIPGRRLEMPALRADGSEFAAELGVSVVRSEKGQPFFTAYVRDVTERKRAEEALRKREAELELVINQTPFMLTRCSRDLRYQFVSRAYAEMLGRQPAELVGRPMVEIMGEEGLDTIRPHVETVLQGTRVEYEMDIPFQGVGVRSLRVVSTPEIDENGHVHGWIGSILDVSERKRAEADRARFLESEQRAREEAEAANRLKDEFLATISHELRTPLNAILGWASMLERRETLDAGAAKGLQSIHRNTRTLAQLVDDVLDVSRIISGKMRLETAPMDLGDVIDAAVEAVIPAANAKDISIHVAVDPAARAITADATRLQQVAWNLLSNAVKFTPPRGRVDVSADLRNREIELRVADTGVGIDPAFLPFVFDRFRQADASTTRTHSGLGLGLAIVRHLTELHGGTVHAESAGRNAGAQFVVRLPAGPVLGRGRTAHQLKLSPLSAATTEDLRIEGFKVLIVDDDRESREVMLEALRGDGASVFAVTSASEAIVALRVFKPDVVLSDIAMPGRDGYAVLAGVRAFETELGRHVPVAAVTAYARPEDRARAIAAGFDEYVAKPVDPAALAFVVATLGDAASRS